MTDGPVLHIDFETRSTVDLRKTGVYVYANHLTTDLWCACYAFDDGPIETWLPTEPVPDAIFDHVMDGGVIFAHNAAFERIIWKHILAPLYGWPEPELTQWRCTMVMSYAMALPGALEDVAPAVGLGIEKDSAGRRLMLQMAKPRKVQDQKEFQTLSALAAEHRRNGDAETADWWHGQAQGFKANFEKIITWWDAPEKLERLIAYCQRDVEVERELHKRLRPLKPSELDLWHLDQKINDRGVQVDVELAEAAKKIVKATSEKLNEELREVTDKAVSACSNRNQLVAWVRTEFESLGLDIKIDSIAKDKLAELLARDDLPVHVRRALELRRESAKASVAKIDALLRGMDEDGRARGLLQFLAASTGRWAGRRFQPQNIKRPDLDDVDSAIEFILTGDVELVEAVYDEPLSVVGDTLRGMIKAGRGKKICAVDYRNIEGRVLAWLAGEEWKLDAFRAFDAGEGPDLYNVMAGKILKKPVSEITKDERQGHGKVPELACGFQGGVGAFQTMAVTYNVNVTDDEAEDIRDYWRGEHPATVQFWRDLEDAAMAAVKDPGSTHGVGDIIYRQVGSFLFCRLPSKRFLAYAYPELRWKEVPWFDDNDTYWVDCASRWEAEELFGEALADYCDDRHMALVKRKAKKLSLSYKGVNSYTRKWERCYAYGGLLAENVTQATSRDVMGDAMPRLEAADYPIILTVHDEIVTEPELEHGSADEMAEIMLVPPAWTRGELPLAVEGFEGERYRK